MLSGALSQESHLENETGSIATQRRSDGLAEFEELLVGEARRTWLCLAGAVADIVVGLAQSYRLGDFGRASERYHLAGSCCFARSP